MTTGYPSLTAACPARRCRACAMTADRCRARHEWTKSACCPHCKHDPEEFGQ